MGDNRDLFDKSQTDPHNLKFFIEKYFLIVLYHSYSFLYHSSSFLCKLLPIISYNNSANCLFWVRISCRLVAHYGTVLICSCTFYIYLYVFSLTIALCQTTLHKMWGKPHYIFKCWLFLSLNILVKSLSIHVGTNYQSFLILEGGTEPSKEWKYD